MDWGNREAEMFVKPHLRYASEETFEDDLSHDDFIVSSEGYHSSPWTRVTGET